MTPRYGFALVSACLLAGLLTGIVHEQNLLASNVVSFFVGVGVTATRPAAAHLGVVFFTFLAAYGLGMIMSGMLV